MTNNIHSVKLSSYEAPEVIEDNREDWVEFGDDNNFFNFILDRYKGSTTNATIINNTAKLIYGRGLSSVDSSRKPNEYATMKALFSKKTLKALALDYKMLGNGALQIIYSKDRKKVQEVHHIPVHLLRPEKCNSEGNIEAYYFCNDWSDTKKFVPERIPAFGESKNAPIEIFYIKPYAVGMKYFGLPDYFGSIPYARLEEDISNYLISEVNSAFASRVLVNLNNGIPDEASQFEIKNKIVNSLTGTDGQKVIVAFNNGQENATTVESLNVADAPDLYSSLSLECEKKILVGHNITSPLMFGISSKNGFSSNSEELMNSFVLYNNMYILPVQDVLTDAIEEILSYNDIALEVFFKTLKPLEFSDKEDRGQEKEKEEETKLSKEKEENDVLELLDGEFMSDEFELIDSREFSDDNESVESWVESTEKKDKKSLLEKLSSVVKSRPSAKSQLDKSIYKVRYKYNAKYNKPESRNFCKQMMTRSANGVVYRLEDIDKASREMNFKSAGLPMHKGQKFSLFTFKGGLNCSHFWSQELYRRKKNKDGSYKEDKALSSNEEVSKIPKSYEPKPRGRQRAKKVEADRADKGHHPNYNK
tara:strand:+ start:1010 stop:2779 length:1770 start_codon:yes stop_codon:yes gene_type:complete